MILGDFNVKIPLTYTSTSLMIMRVNDHAKLLNWKKIGTGWTTTDAVAVAHFLSEKTAVCWTPVLNYKKTAYFPCIFMILPDLQGTNANDVQFSCGKFYNYDFYVIGLQTML